MTLNRTYMISKGEMVALMANFSISSFPPTESELSWKNNLTKMLCFIGESDNNNLNKTQLNQPTEKC